METSTDRKHNPLKAAAVCRSIKIVKVNLLSMKVLARVINLLHTRHHLQSTHNSRDESASMVPL